MVIYGVALLSICMFVGMYLGDALGVLLGVKANVGGVGFAMLFLVLICEHLTNTGKLSKPTESGVRFWSNMYIPIIVAMAMRQDVLAAFSGGIVAIVAGLGAVAAVFALVRPISALADKSTDWDKGLEG